MEVDADGNPRQHFLKIEYEVHYGNFNLYDMQALCEYSTGDLRECIFARAEIQSATSPAAEEDRLDRLRFWSNIKTGYSGVEFIGTFQAIFLAMQGIYYRANTNQNTNRLRSRVYNPMASRSFPFEEMLISVSVNEQCNFEGPYVQLTNMTQLMHIVDLNDTPQISHPKDAYNYPFDCNALSTQDKCHFGQFFSDEDSSKEVKIGGIQIEDIDVKESCPFVNPECAKIDVRVRASRGSVALNTRSRLSFYQNTREAQGFTAFITPSNAAVKMVFYRVEKQENIGPESSILNYNTQHSNNIETVMVTVSDQGLTGAAGVAKKEEISIDVTIVAINDAPVITVDVLEYSILEDELTNLQGITVDDVDLDQQIDSSLARLTWMKPIAAQETLNQIKYRLSVIRGVLRLEYTRNLRVIDVAETTFYTIQATRPNRGHDVCRVDDIYNNVDALQSAAPLVQQQYPDLDMSTIKAYKDGLCLLSNINTADCPTGTEAVCTCFGIFSCEDGTVTLYINNTATPFTKPPVKEPLDVMLEDEYPRSRWLDVLGKAIEARDKTCGGQPVYKHPNNFTTGLKCEVDDDCAESVMSACTLGKNCTCCANISHVCSSDDECRSFDKGSSCGCVAGPPGNGVCGPYCENKELTRNCNTKLITYADAPKLYGHQCTYRAPYPNSKLVGSTEPAIRECRPAAFGINGSTAQKVRDLIAERSSGSKRVTFVGDMIDVKRALEKVLYITDLNYNRLFRPPEKERDLLTYDPEADNVDTLSMYTEDLGNSGGKELDTKMAFKDVPLRVKAVNDKPIANGPNNIVVREDVPFHFDAALGSGLSVSDPDFEDYGFDVKTFTVNLTCSNGRLYLNEEFLKLPGVAYNRIFFRHWGAFQEKRGLHYETLLAAEPRYGERCQFQPQCTDGLGDPARSLDQPYGFFKTEMHGLVYSPQTAGGPAQGCGLCPEDTGNKFISIEGTFNDINQALSFVTYLPDPNFNTRAFGNTEEIRFSVNDNGALGNDANSPSLTHTRIIDVLVDSVNDRPIIGRKVKTSRVLKTYDGGVSLDRTVPDTAIYEVNQTLDGFCSNIPPSGAEYSFVCGPRRRQYIDIDEDTEFYITPDVLWIEDVDSEESQNVEEPTRYCCDPIGPAGCRCGQPCLCDGVACKCNAPPVCKEEVTAGQLRVHFSVKHGVLQYYPPPGRDFFKQSDLVFLTNDTDVPMIEGGSMIPCEVQKDCMQDVPEINIRARKTFLQTGLDQMFLTYKALPDYYGPDTLYAWVSDDGYTDECYNASLVATQTINIRVVGLNDKPVIKAPEEVMVFLRGERCFVDFQEHSQTDTGINKECINNPNRSMLPPGDSGDFVAFSDVDMDDKPYGNLTVTIRVGTRAEAHANAGTLQLTRVIPNSQGWFDLYRDSLTGLMTLQITSKMNEINELMKRLRYDAHPTFQGYVPIRIYADDNKNFGECSGFHKCGYEDVCGDHREAEPHQPVQAGMSNRILASTIGAVGSCGAADCETCSITQGCGFCPGACPETGGKCMVGTKAGPTYETCEPHPRDGRTWNQCTTGGDDNVAIYVSIAVVFLCAMIISYSFIRWVRRRHGSLVIYMHKKQLDFKRAGRKAQILPPDEANYNMFFCLLFLATTVTVVFSMIGSPRPSCNFNFMIFLDRASSIHMESDACRIKFLPARYSPYPDNELQALKMQIAAPVEESVVVSWDTCGLAATIKVANNKDDAVKYVNYWCNVQILVPDRFVTPATTIEAKGDNITYVRAGNMDPDSLGFGLRFGPNKFRLLGNYLVARLQNLSATEFEYRVTKGNLIGIQVDAIEANFDSERADMILTTPTQTSVQFWQKSENLVCLTAAQNSLYVDDSCKKKCEYKRRDRRGSIHDQPESLEIVNVTEANRRQSVLPWKCVDNGDGTQNCTIFDPVQAEIDDTCPVGAQFKKRSEIPKIVGCHDLEFCTLDESSQCLCKPLCDMANLDPPGVCDAFGKCCQIICEGYSAADLFPKPDLPRCGRDVNPDYLWCNGTLDQQWRFTSSFGQVSLEVVEDKPDGESYPKHSSYRGSFPASNIDVEVDILKADKDVLNEAFHPGGANYPNSEWFALRLRGPGTPEAADGEFVWLASVRYLVLPSWLFSFLSMGLLAPTKSAALSGLNPSFCPAFVDPSSAQFQNRLVQMRQMLLDSLQTYPGPDKKAIPFTSLLSFIPVGGSPRVFATDPATNKIGVSLVNAGDYPLVIGVVGLALVIPMILATVFLLTSIMSGYKIVKAYRVQKLKEEQLTANLNKVFTALANVDEDEMQVSDDKLREMDGRTNLFYLFEEFVLASAEAQRTALTEWSVVMYELMIVVAPSVLIYIMLGLLKTAYQANRCEFRPDVCKCFEEEPFVIQMVGIANTVLIVFFFWSVTEMSLFYLSIPYALFRRIVRLGFYLLFYFVIWCAIVFLLVVTLFVLLGILVKPTYLAPYGIAIIGVVACCASLFANKRKFQTRVERAVAKRVEQEKSKMTSVPPILLDILINKNVSQALHEHGLSLSRIVVTVFIFGLAMILVYVFLFIGFNAFTDPNDLTSGVINSGIAFGFALGAHYAVAKDGEEEDVKDAVNEMQESVMRTLKKVFDMVSKQLDLAMKLFKRMKNDVEEAAQGESVDSSSSSSSDSDSK